MHEDVRGPRAGPREPCGATRPPKMAAILASGELSPPLQALTVRTLLACWPPPACGYQRPIGPTSATPILRHACSPSATPSSAVIRDIIGPPEHHDHAPRLRAGPGPGSAPPRDHGVSRPHPRYQDRPPQHAARLRRAPPVDSAGEIPAAKITHSQSSGRLKAMLDGDMFGARLAVYCVRSGRWRLRTRRVASDAGHHTSTDTEVTI